MSYIVYKLDSESMERQNIIEKILSFNWQDDVQNVFISFDFEAKIELNCGDWIELYNSDNAESVFVGVITKTSQSDDETFSYSGYDKGFYLEKNSTVIQYKNAKISKAMEDACNKYSLNVGELPEIDMLVTKIYQNQTLSEILQDLYKIAVDKGLEDKFYFNCKNGKINLLEFKENNNLRGYIANIYSIKSFDFVKSFEKTSSIEELKNRVELYTSNSANNDSTGKKLYTLTDSESVKKYGLLNHIEEVDAEKKQDYQKLIKTKLAELNKVSEEISFDVISDNNLQAGVITTIQNDKINVNGTYKITSSKHSIKGTMENVSVSVEKYEKV